MAAIVWQPSAATPADALEVRVETVIYTFTPGIPIHVEPGHQAAVLAALQATAGTLVSPAITSVTPTLGAAGAQTYELVAGNENGDTLVGATNNTAAGPANGSFDGTHFNTLVWVAPVGAAYIKVVRTIGGPSQGLIATLPGTATTYADHGAAATVYVPAGAPVSQAGAAIIGDVEI